ncbi:UNKNOWN [Stylonychia lemnae]|uniref:Transmembrane protein n=1 Tax=Stylonychia lemnae TaxID=5949 RepID=A0A078AZK6_STYLE|nr:UNKNOWN [Stylonychia lemnae]|eukprot:CDW87604.1 UNKNOWN [Stylonychia lemnae]
MKEPGSCETCPTEKAVCNGGANIGPLPGYWRKSNASQRFEKCLYQPACLGMVAPKNNPMGDCSVGYRGILCADSLLPFLLGYICFQFWLINNFIKKRICSVDRKFISSLVILLFLVHPIISQYSIFNFKCRDIDGQQRVYDDLEILCWDKSHQFYSYFVALPSILVWGIGLPILALIILIKIRNNLNRVSIREMYGFLYRGYKVQFYYWEIVITSRKILIIFITVFVGTSFGLIAQALIMLIVLILFLVINHQFKPFNTQALNDLETISLVTSMISVYSGIFFLLDKSTSWIESNQDYSRGVIQLPEAFKKLFFYLILISNVVFFIFWIYKMYQELKSRFRSQYQKIYLILCLCNDKEKLKSELVKSIYDLQMQKYSEELEKCINKYENYFVKRNIQLNEKIVQKLAVFLDEANMLKAFGYKNEKDNSKSIQYRKKQSQKVFQEFQEEESQKKLSKMKLIHDDSQPLMTQQTIQTMEGIDFINQKEEKQSDILIGNSDQFAKLEKKNSQNFLTNFSLKNSRDILTVSNQNYITQVSSNQLSKMSQLELLVKEQRQENILIQKIDPIIKQRYNKKKALNKVSKISVQQVSSNLNSMNKNAEGVKQIKQKSKMNNSPLINEIIGERIKIQRNKQAKNKNNEIEIMLIEYSENEDNIQNDLSNHSQEETKKLENINSWKQLELVQDIQEKQNINQTDSSKSYESFIKAKESLNQNQQEDDQNQLKNNTNSAFDLLNEEQSLLQDKIQSEQSQKQNQTSHQQLSQDIIQSYDRAKVQSSGQQDKQDILEVESIYSDSNDEASHND